MNRGLAMIPVGILAFAALPPAFGQAREARATAAEGRQYPPTLVDDLFRAGRELCAEYQYDLATRALKRAAKLSPDNPAIWLWLGHALCQSGASREGEAALQQVLGPKSSSEDSRDAPPDEQEHEAGEEEETGQTAKADPASRACALNYLGVMYALRSKKAEAADYFEQAAELETDMQAIAQANQAVLDGESRFTWSVESVAPPQRQQPARGPRGPRRQRSGGFGAPRTPPIAAEAGRARERSGEPPVIKVKLVSAADAITEARSRLEAGDPNQALSVAERASKLDRSIVVKDYYFCISEIYEAKGWLPEAAAALQSASRARDAGAEVATRVQELVQEHPELRLEPRELLTGERLRVRHASPPRIAHRLIGQLGRIRQSVHDSFGVDLPTVYVRIFADEQSLQRYAAIRTEKPQASFVHGRATGAPHSPTIVAQAQARPPQLIANLRHEYAHLVWGALSGEGRLPRWLNEGLAQIVSQGPQPRTQRLTSAYATGRLMGPADLERLWRDPSTRPRADNAIAYLCYEQAQSLVTFLLETRGPDMIIDWLLLVRVGHDPEQAFRALTGQSWEQLFTVWAKAALG